MLRPGNAGSNTAADHQQVLAQALTQLPFQTGISGRPEIIGPQASTLIQPVIQAMSFGLDARSMARGQYWIHPAMPELIENALLNLPLD